MKKIIFSVPFILIFVLLSILLGIISNIKISLLFFFMWLLGLLSMTFIYLPIILSSSLKGNRTFTSRLTFPLFLIASICAIYISPSWGEWISEFRFRHSIEDYNSIAGDILFGKISATDELNPIDMRGTKGFPPGVIDIMAARCEGGAVVMFLTASGGRIHKGYLYKNIGASSSCKNIVPSYYSLSHLQGNWYEFSN